ncbi:hypothetical protein BGZ73_004213 [Actinomortierella ambigua]|nr:hypothetical protein BGZ73_004213 [Actinomortierella ambigua]
MSTSTSLGEGASATSFVKDVYEVSAQKATEMTKGAAASVRESTLVRRLVVPPARFAAQTYNNSPVFVKFSLLTFAAMSTVPIACFLGFMGVVATGLLVIGGIAFAIIEGGFGLFASMFLLPALGVSLLIAGGVGLTSLFMYGSYLAIMFGIGVVRGRGEQAEIEAKARSMGERVGQRMNDI